jgi:low affinity Fe/Cu permease
MKAAAKRRPHHALRDAFGRFAASVATHAGRPAVFLLAVAVILAWAMTGPYFGYSDTWQLIINTGTTVVTFLMVFLIQNTQNRDARAIHLKLDEIIRSIRPAENKMIDIEKLSDEELDELAKHYEHIRLAKEERNRRRTDSAA